MVNATGGPDHPNPLAPVSTQFALAGSSFTPRSGDTASAVGVRPWGLRRARPAGAGKVVPAWTYDQARRMAVGSDGRPLIESPGAGDPTAVTTSSVDGEDPPSSEDWIND